MPLSSRVFKFWTKCINALFGQQVFFIIRILIPDDVFMLSSAAIPMMSSSTIPISCLESMLVLNVSTELV
jgi:hypothetical protein